MSLRNLQNSTDTGNIDNARRVTFDISTALVEQTEKSRRHVIDREGIDVVERSPRIRAIVVEKSSPDSLSVGIFRCLRIVEEIYKRSRNTSAKCVGEMAVSINEVGQQTYLLTRICNFPSFSSISFLASSMLSRFETSREKLPPQKVM